MKEFDPGVKKKFIDDWNTYAQIIRGLQTGQLGLEDGIEICEQLHHDLVRDMDIMDPEAHEKFIPERNKLANSYKKAKEDRLAGMKPSEDAADDRNIKRLILKNYDLKKHDDYLELITKLGSDRGWFR